MKRAGVSKEIVILTGILFIYFFLLLFQDAKEGVLRNLRGFFEKKKSL